MAVLSSKLIISLVDQVSGPAKGILATLQGLSKASTLSREFQQLTAATQRFNATVAAPLGLGLAGIITTTQEFEKALVGVQVAGIADNLEKGVVDFEKLRKEAEATKEAALALSEALRLSPDGLLRAGEAAAKMGLAADKLQILMKMAGSVNIQDSSLSPSGAAEFLGSMGILFKAGKEGFEGRAGPGDYNADITKITNQLLGVASMTRTGAGPLQQGLRQFAPLYASFGESFAATSALIGAMVQAGQLDVESGTALKSLGVRLLRPTAQGREAMLKAGIDRGQFMDLSAVSAGQAFNSLIRLTDVRLTPDQRAKLKAKLVEGEAGKKFMDDMWQQEFLQLYNDFTEAKTAEAKEANLDRVMMSIMTGGGRIKMMEFIKMLGEKMASGELTDAQMAMIGEGRHLSKYKALFQMLPFMQELYDKVKGINSEFSDAGDKLWFESSAGRWQGALAAFQRAFIRLRESEGVARFIESMARLADAIAKADPRVVDALGKSIVGLAAISVGSMALSGVASAITLIGSAARVALGSVLLLNRALIVAPLVAGWHALAAAVLRTRGALVGLSMMYAVGGMRGIGGLLAGGVVARFVALGGAIFRVVFGLGRLIAIGTVAGAVLALLATAAMFVYQNWQGLGSFFSGFGEGFMKGLGDARPAIEGVINLLSQLVGWLDRISGPIDETGKKWRTWGEAAGQAVGGVVAKFVEMATAIQQALTTFMQFVDKVTGLNSFGSAGEWIAKKLGFEAKPPGTKPADAAPAAPAVVPPVSPATPGPRAAAPAGPGLTSDLAGAESKAVAVVSAVQSSMAQAKAIVAAVDLTSEGQRIMETLAAGIRAGAAAVGQAMSEAMSAQVRGAVRGQFSDGGVR